MNKNINGKKTITELFFKKHNLHETIKYLLSIKPNYVMTNEPIVTINVVFIANISPIPSKYFS